VGETFCASAYLELQKNQETLFGFTTPFPRLVTLEQIDPLLHTKISRLAILLAYYLNDETDKLAQDDDQKATKLSPRCLPLSLPSLLSLSKLVAPALQRRCFLKIETKTKFELNGWETKKYTRARVHM